MNKDDEDDGKNIPLVLVLQLRLFVSVDSSLLEDLFDKEAVVEEQRKLEDF